MLAPCVASEDEQPEGSIRLPYLILWATSRLSKMFVRMLFKVTRCAFDSFDLYVVLYGSGFESSNLYIVLFGYCGFESFSMYCM